MKRSDFDKTDRKTLIPPLNFSMVTPGVYRSGYPNRKNFKFLQRLGLRSILYLCPEEYTPDNIQFAKESSIRIFHYGIDGNKEPFIGIEEELMKEAIRHILDVRNHPILVHCNKGTHRTGCVIGCLRKMQQWSLTSIFDEYCRFAGSRIRLLDQQFIELFPHHSVEYERDFAPRWIQGLARGHGREREKMIATN